MFTGVAGLETAEKGWVSLGSLGRGPTQLYTMKIKLSSLWGDCEDLFFLGKLVRHLHFFFLRKKKKSSDELDKGALVWMRKTDSERFPLPNWVFSVHHRTCPVEVNLPFVLMTGPSGDYFGDVTKKKLMFLLFQNGSLCELGGLQKLS